MLPQRFPAVVLEKTEAVKASLAGWTCLLLQVLKFPTGRDSDTVVDDNAKRSTWLTFDISWDVTDFVFFGKRVITTINIRWQNPWYFFSSFFSLLFFRSSFNWLMKSFTSLLRQYNKTTKLYLQTQKNLHQCLVNPS